VGVVSNGLSSHCDRNRVWDEFKTLNNVNRAIIALKALNEWSFVFFRALLFCPHSETGMIHLASPRRCCFIRPEAVPKPLNQK